jgi:hypothetical protein
MTMPRLKSDVVIMMRITPLLFLFLSINWP